MANARKTTTTGRRKPVQIAAAVVGVVFVLVGILGFVPGITSGYDQLQFAGPHSEAMLVGIFQVSILHNVVHLLFGVAGLAMAATFSGGRTFLIGGGVIYLILWVYGLVVDKEAAANFVPLNNADNWLHLSLGVGMIALGIILGRRPVADTTGATQHR